MFFDIVDMTMAYIQYIILMVRISPDSYPDFYTKPFVGLKYFMLDLFETVGEEQRYNNPLDVRLPVWLPLDVRLQFFTISAAAPLALSTICFLGLYSKTGYLWFLLVLGALFGFTFGLFLLCAGSRGHLTSQAPNVATRAVLLAVLLPVFVLLLAAGAFTFIKEMRERTRERQRELRDELDREQRERNGDISDAGVVPAPRCIGYKPPRQPLQRLPFDKKEADAVVAAAANTEQWMDTLALAAQRVFDRQRAQRIRTIDVRDTATQFFFAAMFIVLGLFFIGAIPISSVRELQHSTAFRVFGGIIVGIGGFMALWGILGCFTAGRKLRVTIGNEAQSKLLSLTMICSNFLYTSIVTNSISLFYCRALVCEAGSRPTHARSSFEVLHNTSQSVNGIEKEDGLSGCVLCNLSAYPQRCPASMQSSLCSSTTRQSRLVYDPRVPCDLVDGYYIAAAVVILVSYVSYLPTLQYFLAKYAVDILQAEFPLEQRFIDALSKKEQYFEKVITSKNSASFVYRAYLPQYRYYKISFLLQKLVLATVSCTTRRGLDQDRAWVGIMLFLIVPLIAMAASLICRPFTRPTEAIYFPVLQFTVAFFAAISLYGNSRLDKGGIPVALAVVLAVVVVVVPIATLICATVYTLQMERRRYERLRQRLENAFANQHVLLAEGAVHGATKDAFFGDGAAWQQQQLLLSPGSDGVEDSPWPDERAVARRSCANRLKAAWFRYVVGDPVNYFPPRAVAPGPPQERHSGAADVVTPRARRRTWKASDQQDPAESMPTISAAAATSPVVDDEPLAPLDRRARRAETADGSVHVFPSSPLAAANRGSDGGTPPASPAQRASRSWCARLRSCLCGDREGRDPFAFNGDDDAAAAPGSPLGGSMAWSVAPSIARGPPAGPAAFSPNKEYGTAKGQAERFLPELFFSREWGTAVAQLAARGGVAAYVRRHGNVFALRDAAVGQLQEARDALPVRRRRGSGALAFTPAAPSASAALGMATTMVGASTGLNMLPDRVNPLAMASNAARERLPQANGGPRLSQTTRARREEADDEGCCTLFCCCCWCCCWWCWCPVVAYVLRKMCAAFSRWLRSALGLPERRRAVRLGSACDLDGIDEDFAAVSSADARQEARQQRAKAILQHTDAKAASYLVYADVQRARTLAETETNSTLSEHDGDVDGASSSSALNRRWGAFGRLPASESRATPFAVRDEAFLPAAPPSAGRGGSGGRNNTSNNNNNGDDADGDRDGLLCLRDTELALLALTPCSLQCGGPDSSEDEWEGDDGNADGGPLDGGTPHHNHHCQQQQQQQQRDSLSSTDDRTAAFAASTVSALAGALRDGDSDYGLVLYRQERLKLLAQSLTAATHNAAAPVWRQPTDTMLGVHEAPGSAPPWFTARRAQPAPLTVAKDDADYPARGDVAGVATGSAVLPLRSTVFATIQQRLRRERARGGLAYAPGTPLSSKSHSMKRNLRPTPSHTHGMASATLIALAKLGLAKNCFAREQQLEEKMLFLGIDETAEANGGGAAGDAEKDGPAADGYGPLGMRLRTSPSAVAGNGSRSSFCHVRLPSCAVAGGSLALDELRRAAGPGVVDWLQLMQQWREPLVGALYGMTAGSVSADGDAVSRESSSSMSMSLSAPSPTRALLDVPGTVESNPLALPVLLPQSTPTALALSATSSSAPSPTSSCSTSAQRAAKQRADIFSHQQQRQANALAEALLVFFISNNGPERSRVAHHSRASPTEPRECGVGAAADGAVPVALAGKASVLFKVGSSLTEVCGNAREDRDDVSAQASASKLDERVSQASSAAPLDAATRGGLAGGSNATAVALLRCHCLLRQSFASSYWRQQEELTLVQQVTNRKINGVVLRLLTLLFLSLGIVSTLTLSLVLTGMLDTVDLSYVAGTTYDGSDDARAQTIAYSLAGYRNWTDFITHCCCTAETDLDATFPLYLLDVEEWLCENGKTKERVRRDGYDDDVFNGYSVRALCGMEFLNGCYLESFDDDTRVRIAGCDASVSAESKERW